MADFSNLKQQKQETADFTFWNVVGQPTLVVRPATESNKPYFNEQLRRADQIQRRKQKLTEAMVREGRDKDRELFVKYVIVSWKDVKDAAGNVVTFTRDECAAFVAALDDFLFDQLREFCKDESNFREVNTGDTTAGNSQTA